MSLSASMWTSVSGLLAHGEKMNVVGNNLANVSTVGFRGQRMDFADFVYANTYTSAGNGQIGRGVKVGAIMGNFAQSSFETTTEADQIGLEGVVLLHRVRAVHGLVEVAVAGLAEGVLDYLAHESGIVNQKNLSHDNPPFS